MAFAEELVKNRKKANLTQEALAEKCNVSRQAVQKWEKSESLPDVYLIAKLASMFDLSIEDLIWSRDSAVLENKKYYIRLIEEADKPEFCALMREHRYMGHLLKLIDKLDGTTEVDDIYWNTYLIEGKTFVIRSKERDLLIGYVYLEAIETYAPEMTMQFDSQKISDEFDFALIRDFYNWINKEYNVRAIQVHVNSKKEQELFKYLGYDNVKDEVVLALPV